MSSFCSCLNSAELSKCLGSIITLLSCLFNINNVQNVCTTSSSFTWCIVECVSLCVAIIFLVRRSVAMMQWVERGDDRAWSLFKIHCEAVLFLTREPDQFFRLTSWRHNLTKIIKISSLEQAQSASLPFFVIDIMIALPLQGNSRLTYFFSNLSCTKRRQNPSR